MGSVGQWEADMTRTWLREAETGQRELLDLILEAFSAINGVANAREAPEGYRGRSTPELRELAAKLEAAWLKHLPRSKP